MDKKSVTVTLSTLGVGSTYFADSLNGKVHSIYASINKAVGAGSKLTVTGESTGKRLLLLLDPSTLGSYNYPRVPVCNTSGNSTAALAENIPLYSERPRVIVDAGTSAVSAGTTTVMPSVSVDIYIG